MAYRAKKKSNKSKIAMWILLILITLGFAAPILIQLVSALS